MFPSLLEGLFLFLVLISWPIPKAQHARSAVSGDKHTAPVKDPKRLFTTSSGCRKQRGQTPALRTQKEIEKGCLSTPAVAIKRILLCCSLSEHHYPASVWELFQFPCPSPGVWGSPVGLSFSCTSPVIHGSWLHHNCVYS